MTDAELKYLSVDRGKIHDAVAQAEWAKKKLVWVPHAEAGFVAGSIIGESGDVLTVELQVCL